MSDVPWPFYDPLRRLLRQIHTLMADATQLWQDPDGPRPPEFLRVQVETFHGRLQGTS